jgi:uncharacterized DUF497 family protein
MRFDFEWDAQKATSNLAKHGVSFSEASSAFLDPLACVVHDHRHSRHEERMILFGHSASNRLLAVMFAERTPRKLRIISARPVTRRERHEYEETL